MCWWCVVFSWSSDDGDGDGVDVLCYVGGLVCECLSVMEMCCWRKKKKRGEKMTKDTPAQSLVSLSACRLSEQHELLAPLVLTLLESKPCDTHTYIQSLIYLHVIYMDVIQDLGLLDVDACVA